jgi:tRNA nucleotidyltransferase/poly(A) polymerase
MEDKTQALFEHPVVRKIADCFSDTRFSLYLVGGCVRDAVDGRDDFSDLDFTTDALPEQIETIVGDVGPLWLAGKRFGTIGVFVKGEKVEITTFRGEVYEEDSRKPEVTFSEFIEDDLGRRDFTVNALALRVDGESAELLDYHQGVRDLKDKILRTPSDPTVTIQEDPLRAVRAVRFAATRGFRLSVTLQDAIRRNVDRLEIVAPERIMEECRKIFSLDAHNVHRAFVLSRSLDINTFMFGMLDLRNLEAFEQLEIMNADGYTALALMLADTAVEELELDGYLSLLHLPSGEKDAIKKIVTIAVYLKDLHELFTIRSVRRNATPDEFGSGAIVGNLVFGFDGDQKAKIASVALDQRLDGPLPVDGDDVMDAMNCPPGPFVGAALKMLEAVFCIDPDSTREELLAVLTSSKGA